MFRRPRRGLRNMPDLINELKLHVTRKGLVRLRLLPLLPIRPGATGTRNRDFDVSFVAAKGPLPGSPMGIEWMPGGVCGG